ncbi:hypothetical protein KX816_00295 [Sphingosinicellaceae bacterium]|nr:hypothetical protein KX816_00295 [Sphingosinicellaceae bacterium]
MAESNLKRVAKGLYRGVHGSNYPRLIRRGAVERPNYGYIVYQAAELARRLGKKRISVLEFGVAGGRGLINLEMHAARVEKLTGVAIEIYGFDTGEGLPPPVDYRDLPYVWQAAHFRMDRAALEKQLTRSKLVIGLVADTVKTFVRDFDPAPIGAISFDLDYYSSTVDAFKILDLPAERRLPRAFVYFDDILGSDLGHVGEGVGVPLALAEFNAASETRKLMALPFLEYSYAPAKRWHRQIYSYCDFAHPDFDTYIMGADRQLAI